MAVIKKVKVVEDGNYTSKVKEASDGDNYSEEVEDSDTGFIEKVKKVSTGFSKATAQVIPHRIKVAMALTQKYVVGVIACNFSFMMGYS